MHERLTTQQNVTERASKTGHKVPSECHVPTTINSDEIINQQDDTII